MPTISRTGINPAVGAKGLIGYAQEGSWGSQTMNSRKYVDMLNEAMVSEIGALISGSLRSDRAVHKRIGGVEAAGGDINVELGPTGYGSWLKHALGSVTTTRLDDAIVVKVTGSVSTAILSITHVAGLSTAFDLTITGGTGNFNADLTDATADTIGELMVLINNHADLTAYSPYSYRNDATPLTTLQSTDYSADADVASSLEALSSVDLLAHADDAWVVNRGWGVYSHQIDASEIIPEGCSILVGRDVAAFLYSGCRVNTLAVNAVPAEILGATFGWMAKGGTTASFPTAVAGNTGNEKNAFDIKYTGAGATCTLTIVKGDTFQIDSATGSEDILLNIAEEYVDPDNGRVWAVHKLGGLLEFLKEKSYLWIDISPFADWEMPTTSLKVATAADINLATAPTFNFDSADLVADPVLWGDYIGTDTGTAIKFYVKVHTTAGVPGTARLEFSTDGSTYYNNVLSSATEATEVRTGSGNVDTGFTVFFPDDTALIAGDVWTFESIYAVPTSPTYASDQDPFSGFEGALTIDNVAQNIMGWTATLNNNLFGDKYHLGARTRGMLPAQQRSIEGSLTVEFDDLDLYRRFLNGTPADLSIVFSSILKVSNTAMGNSKTDFALTIRQPNIEFNGATPVVGGMEIITVDMPFVALWDDTNSLPDMRVVLVNDVGYL